MIAIIVWSFILMFHIWSLLYFTCFTCCTCCTCFNCLPRLFCCLCPVLRSLPFPWCRKEVLLLFLGQLIKINFHSHGKIHGGRIFHMVCTRTIKYRHTTVLQYYWNRQQLRSLLHVPVRGGRCPVSYCHLVAQTASVNIWLLLCWLVGLPEVWNFDWVTFTCTRTVQTSTSKRDNNNN